MSGSEFEAKGKRYVLRFFPMPSFFFSSRRNSLRACWDSCHRGGGSLNHDAPRDETSIARSLGSGTSNLYFALAIHRGTVTCPVGTPAPTPILPLRYYRNRKMKHPGNHCNVIRGNGLSSRSPHKCTTRRRNKKFSPR
jgi:hypothetical protein